MEGPQGNGAGQSSGPIVPRDILRRDDLSPIDKLVYSYVADMARFFAARGGAFQMSMARVASETAIAERSVRSSVARLCALGLLSVAHRPGQTSTIDPGTVCRGSNPTPARFAEVPRHGLPDTPARFAYPPGTVCRGTPARFADERTTVTNYSSEREVATSTPPAAFHVDDELSRVRRSFARAFERVTKTPFTTKPADLDTFRLAAQLGTCRPWPDDHALLAEIVRTLEGMQRRGVRYSVRTAINHLGESWDEPPAQRQNGKDPFPEVVYEDFTGRGKRGTADATD